MNSQPLRMVFRYRIEFDGFGGSIDTSHAFTNRCRDELDRREIDLFSNHLMHFQSSAAGMVFREGATVTEDERQSIRDWIVQQPVRGKITIGYLEPFEDSSVVGGFDGDSYQVDNLEPGRA